MSIAQTTPVPGLSAPAAQRAGTTVITKRFDFEAAHFLPNVADDHKCRRVHGHSYEVHVHVAGPMDADAGWVVDFGDVKAVWKPLEQRLDHHMLNEVDGLENPTAENLAAWIWERYDEERRAGRVGFSVSAVEVAETKDSRAMFVPPAVEGWVPGHRSVALPKAGDAVVALDARTPAATAESATASIDADGLADVQSRPDSRGVALDEVGVRNVRIPLTVLDRAGGRQSTVAVATLGVDVPAAVKGTHMSRFLQSLRDHGNEISLFTLSDLTADLRQRLDGTRVRVRLEFPYFIERPAPVTGELGTLDVDCAFEVIDTKGDVEHSFEVSTPVTTVCPCSRDISDYGAHNQRGYVDVRIRCATDEGELPSLVWIEELVDTSEQAASSPVYPVIKRPDERHVTMAAYDNPRFVEDVARDVSLVLQDDDRIASFSINVTNDESIHAHDAYVSIQPN